MKTTIRKITIITSVLFTAWIVNSVHQRLQLSHAARHGDLDTILYYYDRGLDMNARVFFGGKTPLRIAFESENIDAFRLLMNLGASADIVAKDGLSVTDLSASSGDVCWLKIALSHGADPNRFNNARAYNSGTPLYFAIKNGRLKNVQVLLNYGANPDISVDYSGATALTRASAFAEWDIVILLLRSGADVEAGPPGGSFVDSLRQRDFSVNLDEFEIIKTLLGSDYEPQIVFKGSYFGRDKEGNPMLSPTETPELVEGSDQMKELNPGP